jgi:gluconate 2-dehydrogenase
MNVLYVDQGVNERAEREYGAKKVDLDELLRTSDFVLLQAPLTPETKNLISTPQLKAMKRSAFLINASRGPIVDEAALVEALKDGTIAGAGLDVYVEEPLSLESPLLKLDNVVTLPHIGSATHETRAAMNKNAAENLIAALNGTLKTNIVNRRAEALRPLDGPGQRPLVGRYSPPEQRGEVTVTSETSSTLRGSVFFGPRIWLLR